MLFLRSSHRAPPSEAVRAKARCRNWLHCLVNKLRELTLQDLLRVLKREVERSSVLDLLMEGSDRVKAVLTVSRELLTPEVEAYLIGGRFNVIGKVSAIVDGSQSINLIRRTVFGFGGRQLADQMFGDFNRSMAESGGIDLSLAQTVIDGPAIQVLPLAIYL